MYFTAKSLAIDVTLVSCNLYTILYWGIDIDLTRGIITEQSNSEDGYVNNLTGNSIKIIAAAKTKSKLVSQQS